MEDRTLDQSATFLEAASRWIGWLGSVAMGYAALIHAWYNSRFKGMSDRLDAQQTVIGDHSQKISNHEAEIRVLAVHVEKSEEGRKEIRESMRVLHSKLDRVLERSG